MSGFYGQYQTTMDDKGRFALPAKLRSVLAGDDKPLLEGNLIITKGLEGCLSLYPQGEWTEIQNRLSSLNFTKRDYPLYKYQRSKILSVDICFLFLELNFLCEIAFTKFVKVRFNGVRI